MGTRNRDEDTQIGMSPAIEGVEIVSAIEMRYALLPRISSAGKIVHIESGARRFRYRNAIWTAGAGSLLYLPPGAVHASEPEGEQPATVSVLSLPPALWKSVAPDAALETGLFSADPALERAFRRLRRCLSEPALATEAHPLICDWIINFANDAEEISSEASPALCESVTAVKRYLEIHYRRAISLNELAQVACVSPCHFNRLFSQSVGMPPHAYQIGLRVTQAKLLLLAGVPVSQAALAVGFHDHAHFSRAFFSVMRVSPSAYQKSARNYTTISGSER